MGRRERPADDATKGERPPGKTTALLQAIARAPVLGSGQPSELRDPEFPGTERFRVVAKLGAGGMGLVYRVHDTELGRDVALKTLQRLDPSELYCLKNEFRALADVAHPNLVSLYELFSEGDRWFFTMELVDGVDLCAWVRGDGPTGAAAASFERSSPGSSPPAPSGGERDYARVRSALLQLATGVNEIHRSGRLHRDIKPSNVLVTRSGRVVLLDFGLAVERRRLDSGQSITEGPVGTPAYMSPEQTTSGSLGPESDWYGVGALLYEVLTGKPPFYGTWLEVMEAKRQQDPVRPGDLAAVPADLDSLCMALLRRAPQDRPRGEEVLARLGATGPAGESGRAPRSHFVGRRAELDALESAHARACEGATVTVHIHGPSGIGKTALVEHFLENLRGNPKVTVLAGRCYERETVPYKALDSLIDSLSRHLRRGGSAADALLPRELRSLVRLFPVLRRARAVADAPMPAGPETPDPHEQKRRAFASLKELLGRIADRGPLVVWIDDLHWGDLDSAALLAELVRPPDAPAVLLVLTYRTEDGSRNPCVMAMRGQASGVRELQLHPLEESDARELATALLPSADAPRAAQVAREAAGNPLFVAELARQEHSATASFGQMLLARTARLEPEARRLLEVISVAGGPIDAGCALRAAATENAFATLAVLRAGRLTRGSGDDLETYHDRIRETVVRHLDGARVREVHAALAAALEASDRADPEALAIHLHAAGDFVRAVEFATRAARLADAALAFDRSARLYRLALELIAPDAAGRRELQISLAVSLANAGRGQEAGHAFVAAAEGAEASLAIDLRSRAAEQFMQSGHLSEGMALLRAGLDSIGLPMAATPRGALLSLLLGRARVRLRGLSYRERDAATVEPGDLLRLDVCRAAMTSLSFVDVIHGADFTARHTLLALRGGEPLRVGTALTLEAIHVATAGGRTALRRAERILQAARSIEVRIREPYLTGMADLCQGIIAFYAGGWRQGLRFLDQAASVLRDRCTGVTWWLDATRIYSIGACFRLGEAGELVGRVLPFLEDAQSRGDLLAMTMARTGHANLIWLAADDIDMARRQAELAREQWSYPGFQVQHWNILVGEAAVDLYAGNGKRAWGRLRASWPAFRRSLLPRLAYVRSTTVLLRGASALAAAEESPHSSEAMSLLADAERAAADLERGENSSFRPTGLLLRAGVAAMRRRTERALRLLEEAARGLDAAEMGLDAAAARRRHGQLAGGDAGRAEVQAAEAWMLAREIRNPGRITQMLVPGLGR